MPGARLRLFVALELPAPVRDVLSRWQSEMLRDEPGVRRVAAGSLHVTLCFLGATPEGRVADAVAACETARGCPARDLSLAGAVWLPSRRRPRVLAVGIQDPHGDLARLQSTLGAALATVDLFQPEKRPFLGHVTVARTRGGEQARRPELTGPRGEPFDGRVLGLYRSHLGGGPARYEALHRIRLSRR